MSIPVWQIPPVDIAKAVEALRVVRLGQQMLRERAMIERDLNIARSAYKDVSKKLDTVRRWAGQGALNRFQSNAWVPEHEQRVCAALDDIWTAQENLKRWEAWFD